MPDRAQPAFDDAGAGAALEAVRTTVHVVESAATGHVGIARGGQVHPLNVNVPSGAWPLVASLGPIYPEWLGDRAFTEVHKCRFPYIVGEMARGIATAEMVAAAGRAGLLGFFGSAGLMPDRIEKALVALSRQLDRDGIPWGANLIHSPQEPELERATTDLFLAHGVRRVSASAFMALTRNLVRYACRGLHRIPSGQVQRANYLVAKISRPEVARHFMSPPPEKLLDALVAEGELSKDEAAIAREIPLAEDITVEADSGGHTDNRPLTALFPVIQGLRERIARQHPASASIRLGAAGGLGNPAALASAFALGADYVLTGSVNQSAVESGLSLAGKRLLAEAGIADVAMAPAADMFEQGVKLQVLKRGTLFSSRADSLYKVFTQHPSVDAIPADLRERLERDVFGVPLDAVWEATRSYFQARRPEEIERAERDPKHRLALVCRWYLGNSSVWAIDGNEGRRGDFQIWCGPAQGAFNQWVASSFLEPPENRSVAQIGLNLLEGAAVITRLQHARSYGVPLRSTSFHYMPRRLS